MKLADIIISEAFRERPPAESKMDVCREYFREYGKLDRSIVVSHEGVLIDGYIGYLVLLENGVKEYDVQTSEISLYRESKDYHNTSTTYVYGQHGNKKGEYVWRVTPKTKFSEHLAVGGRAMVDTKQGFKVITITNIKTLNEPPVKGAVKKVIKCLIE